MKRVVLLIVALLGAWTVLAQDQGVLDAFARTLSSGEVRFKYTFEVKGDLPLKGSGAAALCDNAYHIIGNEMEIWCDGRTRWTVDRNTCEAYIETVEQESSDYLTNPVALLSALTRAFEIGSVSDVTLGGKKLQSIRMSPAIAETGLRDVTLYLSGAVPERVVITVDDGTQTLFRISDYKTLEKSDASAFAFDIASLGREYVVTDLR